MTYERDVTITAIETVRYVRSFPLSELEAEAGMTLKEAGSLLELVRLVQNDPTEGFTSALEKHGDVLGQDWTAEFVKDALVEAVKAARKAANGNSNDKEIELLQDALELALVKLGLEIEGDDEDEDEDEDEEG